MKKYGLYIYLPLFLLLFASCSSNSYTTIEGTVWHTFYHITYCGSTDMTDSVMMTLMEVEKSVSAFDKQSTVSRINRNETVLPDSCFVCIYCKSREVWEESDRYFDPTLAPLINAYGFGYADSLRVDRQVIDSIREFVGFEKTALIDGKLIKSDPRIEFNFSAIAKGYGCDKVAEMFRRNGINDFMIEIGGEIVVSGKNPSGEKWQIGVDNPEEGSGAAQTVICVTDCGIATSGNYRNYHEHNGKRIGHTLDPTTGEPTDNDLLSATIIAPSCMEADAYATASMAMGSRKAQQVITRLRMPAMFIRSDGSVWYSPQMQELVKK